MTLETLLAVREEWQKNTVHKMREKILFKPACFIPSERSEKLVVIYGPPQIGKTTLILYLLGISREYQSYVYDVLRAGIPRGNSSTSTAIIYQQSPSKLFGIKYGAGDENSDIAFWETDEFKQELNKLRSRMENGKGRTDILYIYIPCEYFDKRMSAHSNINILDLPGDGSRNTKEKEHVNLLINKYLAISTVNIIACRANEIQSLEDLKLPVNVDWRNLPHKYIIVITNAYSQGSIKKYFKIKKEERNGSFWDRVSEAYQRSMEMILGKHNEIEYFPIDIGDSLHMLFTSGIKKADQEELLAATEKMGEQIRQSIQKRNGNGLKSTIMDLKSYASAYALERMEDAKKDIADLECELKEKKADSLALERRIETCRRKIEELQEKHEAYVSLKQTAIRYDYSKQITCVYNEIYANVQGACVKDPEKKILMCLENQLFSFTEELIKSIPDELHYELPFPPARELYANAVRNILLEEELFPKYYSGGLFRKKPKQNEYMEKVNTIFEDYTKQLDKLLKGYIATELQRLKRDEDDYTRYNLWMALCEKDISANRLKKAKTEQELEKKKSQLQTLEEQKKHDFELLNSYLNLAREEFLLQKKEIHQAIASNNTSLSEKIYLIIFLGIIEKDYQNIIEMG